MQKRLRAIGLRPISALVDITNYVTFDRGRPLHVFDAAKVKGALHVRRARAGESVLALDGKTYALDESMVVIADDDGVESIAGVMGGEHSGCDENTRDVLIESALWDPANIAQTGRKLGIVTDARYRFERGVDPDFCVPGAELATRLVIDFCGGEPSRLIVAGDPAKPKRAIDFPYSEVKRLTGLDIPQSEGEAILARLGFEVEDGKAIVPNWRPDIDGKADIVEQIVRIAGLDRVPTTPLARLECGVPKPVLTPLQKRTRAAKRTLAALGLREAVTWSFIAKPKAELFGGGAPALALANPIAADLSDMRPSLVPGLVAAAERNARRGLEGRRAVRGRADLPRRRRERSAHRRGGGAARHGQGARAKDAIGPAAARSTRSTPRATRWRCSPRSASRRTPCRSSPGGPAFLHPGRSATLQFGPKNIAGWFGELHPSACEALDAEGPLVAFEIIARRDPAPKARPTKAKPKLERSEFMPLERDLAFVVAESARGRRHPQGGARRRPRADRGRRRVRRLSRPRRAGGSQVGGDHGDVAAARAHADRRRNRGGRRQNRRRGRQEDRRDAAAVGKRTMRRRCLSRSAWRASCSARPRGRRTIPPAPNTEEPLAYNACLAKLGPRALESRAAPPTSAPRGEISRGRRGRMRLEFDVGGKSRQR